MSKIRFSIITCTKNNADFIEELIASVSKQSFRNYEHIFIDAGSTDGTLHKILAYKLKNKKVKIYFQKPHGVALAMNFGLTKASGKYVCFLHADDKFYGNNVLADINILLKQNRDPPWVYGKLNIINELGKNLLTIDPPEFNYERLKRENYIPHPTVFVDHKLLVQSHGFGKFTYAMDYDLWLRMSKKITAVKFPLIVSSFRKNKKSLTSSNVWATTIEDYKIRCRLPRRYDIIVRDFINFVYGLFLSWKI